MKFEFNRVQFKKDIPKLEEAAGVFRVHAAGFDRMGLAISKLQQLISITEPKIFHSQNGIHYVGEQGEVQFYWPSGSIWAYNSRMAHDFADERRDWEVEEVLGDDMSDAPQFVLSEKELMRARRVTENFISGLELLPAQPDFYFSGVELEQISRFDEEGKELSRRPGEATAKYLYRLDGLSVDGPGAKTYTFLQPNTIEPCIVGVYHACREVLDRFDVDKIEVEEALAREITSDRQLQFLDKRLRGIHLNEVEVVYFSMPPDRVQEFIFPAIRVAGTIELSGAKSDERGFDFARFYHALPPESYSKAGIYADYLVSRM